MDIEFRVLGSKVSWVMRETCWWDESIFIILASPIVPNAIISSDSGLSFALVSSTQARKTKAISVAQYEFQILPYPVSNMLINSFSAVLTICQRMYVSI